MADICVQHTGDEEYDKCYDAFETVNRLGLVVGGHNGSSRVGSVESRGSHVRAERLEASMDDIRQWQEEALPTQLKRAN